MRHVPAADAVIERHRDVESPTEVNVHLAFAATDVGEHSLLSEYEPIDSRIRACGDVGGDPRRAALRAEDDAEQKLGYVPGIETPPPRLGR